MDLGPGRTNITSGPPGRLCCWARDVACRLFFGFGLLLSLAHGGEGQQRQEVPVIDAKAGPCSVELTVTDVAEKPVYAATIRVHISYGFLGLRRTDFEIGTNVDGKARFVGLPQDSDELLYFRASKGRQTGRAVHSTAKQCEAHQFIVLRRR